jgi:hypothetical protein
LVFGGYGGVWERISPKLETDHSFLQIWSDLGFSVEIKTASAQTKFEAVGTRSVNAIFACTRLDLDWESQVWPDLEEGMVSFHVESVWITEAPELELRFFIGGNWGQNEAAAFISKMRGKLWDMEVGGLHGLVAGWN